MAIRLRSVGDRERERRAAAQYYRINRMDSPADSPTELNKTIERKIRDKYWDDRCVEL